MHCYDVVATTRTIMNNSLAFTSFFHIELFLQEMEMLFRRLHIIHTTAVVLAQSLSIDFQGFGLLKNI